VNFFLLCYRKQRDIPRSDTTTDAAALLGARPLPQDLLSTSRPEELKGSSIPYREFSLPTTTLQRSPLMIGKSEFAISRILWSRVLCLTIPRNPMRVNIDFLPCYRSSPIRKSLLAMSTNLISKLRTPMCRSSDAHVWVDFSTFYPSIGISEFAGSRILMLKDSGLTFSRSPIWYATCPPLTLTVAHTTFRRDIAFRDSKRARVSCLRKPRFSELPTPRDLLTHVPLMDGSELIGISRIAISQFSLQQLWSFDLRIPDMRCHV
jgi:hypothetical protein